MISIPFQVKAGYDLEYNMLTLHYFESCEVASGFENKSFDCGKAIRNPLIALKDRRTGIRGLFGSNSVGSWMAGFTTTAERPSFLIGAYLQDVTEFRKRGIVPITLLTDGNIALTPIIGYEASLRFYGYKVFSIITPVLATVGVGYEF